MEQDEMFYTIPTLKSVDADRTNIPANGLVDPIRVGTGTVHAAELKDGSGQASFCDSVHGVFKEFKAETWIAAYFEAMTYAETHACPTPPTTSPLIGALPVQPDGATAMMCHIVMDNSGPVKGFTSREEADAFVPYWRKRDKRRKVWVVSLHLH